MGVQKNIRDKATVDIASTRLPVVSGTDMVVRTATRMPADLRDELKIQSVVMRTTLNQLYCMALETFLNAKPWEQRGFEFKRPRTAPRKAADGSARGDEQWIQAILMMPASLLKRLTTTAESQQVSVASLAYSAFDWSVTQRRAVEDAMARRRAVAG